MGQNVNIPSGVCHLQGQEDWRSRSVHTYCRQSIYPHSASRPQHLEVNGTTYDVALRFKRTYKPYTMRLERNSRTTTIQARKFPRTMPASMQLEDPSRSENREIKIWMNHPAALRRGNLLPIGCPSRRTRHDSASRAQSRLDDAVHLLRTGGPRYANPFRPHADRLHSYKGSAFAGERAEEYALNGLAQRHRRATATHRLGHSWCVLVCRHRGDPVHAHRHDSSPTEAANQFNFGGSLARSQ